MIAFGNGIGGFVRPIDTFWSVGWSSGRALPIAQLEPPRDTCGLMRTGAGREVCALFTLALVWAAPAVALNPHRLLSQIQKHHWQIEDGLPHNYVNAITHAPDGYLLIGTDEGLARFDGVRFSAVPADQSLHLERRWIMNLLPSRRGGYWVGTYDGSLYRIQNGAAREHITAPGAIQGLFEDSSGAVWYQSGGLHRRDAAGDRTFPGCDGNLGNSWSLFAEDRAGAVWIAHLNGVCRYRDGRAEGVIATGPREGTPLTLLAERDGTLWLGTSVGLYRITEAAGGARLTALPGIAGPVSCLLRDRDGVLWAGTWGKGLWRIAGGSTASWSSRDGLADDFIRTLFEDREGNLWFGSRSGGLNRWKDTLLDPFGIPEGMTGNFASAVSADPEGDLWLGTYRSGLYRVRDGTVTRAPAPVPELDLVVGALAHDASGSLWVGAWHGFFRYRDLAYTSYSDRLPAGCGGPLAIAFDGPGRLWLGCASGLYRFPRGEPQAGAAAVLPGANVHTLLAAADGTVWAGTSQGLAHIAGDRVDWITAAQGLPDNLVRYVSADRAGRVWATTNAPGLVLVSGPAPRVLDTRHGLPAHSLYKPLDDGAGSLWVSSSRGLLELPVRQIEEWIAGRRAQVDMALHDLDDGMRSIECHGASQPGGWRNSDGSLWFPTAKGFVRVQPGQRRRLAPPEVVVEEASAGGAVLPRGAVRLAPGARELEVRYTALRFGAADHVRFRYRVESVDQDWVDVGAARSVRLPALAPGTYRLQVAARDEGQEWSPRPASLAIEQLPLFRQTLLFKLLLAASCACMAAVLYRWRIRRLRGRYAAVTEERNRIAREWHDTLLAGLSGISWQLEAARSRLRSQPEQAPAVLEVAGKMVDHCAAEARRVIWDLRDSGPENPPLPQAIASFHRKLREGTAIEGAVETRGAYVKLPYDLEHNALRVAQEAIANAVHHAAASRIEVSVEYTARQLMLQVSDNGKGFVPGEPSPAGGHFGILGMRERVLNFGGVFEMDSAPGAGTRVEARFPVDSEATA